MANQRGFGVKSFLALALVAVVALAVTGVWNPFPGVWDWVKRSEPISEPDVVWQERIGGTPRSVTIAGDAVVVEQRTRVEARSLATGVQLWERKADWAAVAGADGTSVVAVGKLLLKGYELLDPVTGAVLRKVDDAVAVWTYRNLLLDARCAGATDCTLSAWDPRGTRPLWTAFLPGVSTSWLADNPDLLNTRRLTALRVDEGVAGPESVPPLLGFPVDGRVHVVDTATGRVLQDLQPARDERLSVVGGRLLRITARSVDGACLFGLAATDPATGQQVWQRAGINLRNADNAGCAQREDPQGARNVLIGLSPEGREVVVDGYTGRFLQVDQPEERLLAVDDRYSVVRSADQRTIVGRELAVDRDRWSRPSGGKTGVVLTPYAAVISDEKPTRLVAVHPRTGQELLHLRTAANALAIGPGGMVIGEGREIGYVRFGTGVGPGAEPAGGVPGDGAVPGSGEDRPGTSGNPADCGPKREACPDPGAGKDG
ncbi:hypothetical protein AWW66_27615 [Micromonospora rosaria]|uniref:Pyrrolo-quinoline quinone repeat domain-containing protein n=1 Tax=Micromonospora rosaria TaxID=47874 RepID=A0A136PKD6_9ACTN|nr:PQQ-binding-like beta-propeller repeat protein [Micromonospora rosaria]KXK58826.1 hypothetical protein AWW66_27615 [Micromonospora rosaria]